MDTDKHRWNPTTLFLWGILCIALGPALMTDIQLKPVKDTNGEIVHKVNGGILFQSDYWSTFKHDWLSSLLILIGILLIVGSIFCMVSKVRRVR